MKKGFSSCKKISQNTFYKIILAVSFISLCGCNSDGTASGSDSIGYISFKDEGCSSNSGLAKSNDEPVIDYCCYGDCATVSLIFTTLCESSFKDKVFICGNMIDIYLDNVSNSTAECICSYTETFSFRIFKHSEYIVRFNYKHLGRTEYNLLAERTIYL